MQAIPLIKYWVSAKLIFFLVCVEGGRRMKDFPLFFDADKMQTECREKSEKNNPFLLGYAPTLQD